MENETNLPENIQITAQNNREMNTLFIDAGLNERLNRIQDLLVDDFEVEFDDIDTEQFPRPIVDENDVIKREPQPNLSSFHPLFGALVYEEVIYFQNKSKLYI